MFIRVAVDSGLSQVWFAPSCNTFVLHLAAASRPVLFQGAFVAWYSEVFNLGGKRWLVLPRIGLSGKEVPNAGRRVVPAQGTRVPGEAPPKWCGRCLMIGKASVKKCHLAGVDCLSTAERVEAAMPTCLAVVTRHCWQIVVHTGLRGIPHLVVRLLGILVSLGMVGLAGVVATVVLVHLLVTSRSLVVTVPDLALYVRPALHARVLSSRLLLIFGSLLMSDTVSALASQVVVGCALDAVVDACGRVVVAHQAVGDARGRSASIGPWSIVVPLVLICCALVLTHPACVL